MLPCDLVVVVVVVIGFSNLNYCVRIKYND